MKKTVALLGVVLYTICDLEIAFADIPKFLTLPFKDSSIHIQQAWIYTWGPPHDGIDYIKGTLDRSGAWETFDVVAAAAGRAVAVKTTPKDGKSAKFGIFVYVFHDETDNAGNHYFTLYAHLDRELVNPKIPFISLKQLRADVSNARRRGNPPPWEPIGQGEFLGNSGETGAEGKGIHLHFEVHRGGYAERKTDPYDIADAVVKKKLATRIYYRVGDKFTKCGQNFLWTECPPEVMLPVPAGTLLFTSNSGGNFEIYTIKADGTELTNLTQNAANDANHWANPWSPDGSQIAFASNRDGFTKIYVMNSNGTEQSIAVDIQGTAASSWSPDGQQLVFDLEASPQLYIINLNGGDPSFLTSGNFPQWSALNKIAFETAGGIGIINPDGTGLITIDESVGGGCPSWSSDGSKLAFLRHDANPNRITITIVNHDGSDASDIFTAPLSGPCPNLTWSPDGQRLAFSESAGLYIINADGTGLENLIPEDINGNSGAFWPAWSPDGNLIAFSSRINSDADIFVINVHDKSLRNLTNSPDAHDMTPFWKPAAPALN